MTQAITSAAAPIQELPPEIFLKHIIVESGELDFQDIGRLQKVCRLFYECLQHDFIWKPFLSRDFPLQECQEKVQQAYRRAHLLRSNLINGIFRSVTIGKFRPRFSHPVLAVVNDTLIYGGLNQNTMLWDLRTERGHNLSPERNNVFASGDGPIFFFGHSDGDIAVYDLETTGHVLTFDASVSPILSLAYSGGKLFSGAKDGTIKVWDWTATKKALPLKELRGNAPVVNLAVSGNTLVSIDETTTVKFWDLTTYECRHQFDLPGMTSLTLAHQRLIVGFSGGEIEIISLENGTVLHQLEGGHHNEIKSLIVCERILFSQDFAHRIAWDLATGKLLNIKNSDIKSAYAYSKGTLFYIDSHFDIRGENYLADNDEVLGEIAHLLRDESMDFRQVMVRYFRMPTYIKERISKQVPAQGWADEWAAAIESYLAKRKKLH